MFPRQTEPETMEISRAAEVFQTTLQVLKNRVRRRYKRDVTAAGRLAFCHLHRELLKINLWTQALQNQFRFKLRLQSH